MQHAKLGVTVQEVNQGFADSFKLESPEGALVSNVEKGGPADKAGLKSGDVIRKVNGQPIVASGDLPAIDRAWPSRASKVALDVWREGKTCSIDATPGQRQRQGGAGRTRQPARRRQRRQAGPGPASAGAGREARVRRAGRPGGRGCGRRRRQTAGVQPGDVLLSVNGTPVDSVEQVREVVRQVAQVGGLADPARQTTRSSCRCGSAEATCVSSTADT